MVLPLLILKLPLAVVVVPVTLAGLRVEGLVLEVEIQIMLEAMEATPSQLGQRLLALVSLDITAVVAVRLKIMGHIVLAALAVVAVVAITLAGLREQQILVVVVVVLTVRLVVLVAQDL